MPLLHAERVESLKAGSGEEASEIGFASAKVVRRRNTKQRAMEKAKGRIENGSVSVKDRFFEVSGQNDQEHVDGRHATYLYILFYAFVAPRTVRRSRLMMSSVSDLRYYASFVHDEISSRVICVSCGLDSTTSEATFDIGVRYSNHEKNITLCCVYIPEAQKNKLRSSLSGRNGLPGIVV